MRFFPLVMIIASVFSMSGVAKAALAPGECEILKRIVNEIPDDFAKLKAGDKNKMSWKVTISLPGQKACLIDHGNRIIYRCVSNAFPPDTNMIPARDARLADIMECLGPVWITDKNILNEFYVSTYDPDTNRSVIVASQVANGLGEQELRTDIYRMNQKPLEPPPLKLNVAAPIGYCEDLKQIVADSKNGFASAIGGMEKTDFGSSVHWDTKISLSNWAKCYVSEWNNRDECRSFTCDTKNVADEIEAGTLQRGIASDIQTCLNGGWMTGLVTHQMGSLSLVMTKPQNPMIEIQPGRSVASDAWNVSLHVANNFACGKQ